MPRLKLLGVPAYQTTAPDEEELAVGKPFALLAYVALSEEPVARDHLAELFWPGSDVARARASLRQALSHLRKVLGPGAFERDDPVELVPGAVETDVADLRVALREGRLDAAWRLGCPPLLEGVRVEGSVKWYDWVQRTGARVCVEFYAALVREVRLKLASGDAERAFELARRATRIHPFCVEGHLLSVEAAVASGELHEARILLERGREAPTRGSGADEVWSEMEGLLRRAEEQREAAAVQDVPQLPFTGRSDELMALWSAWRRAVRRRSELAILTGAPGIGKTRLLGELERMVTARGGQVGRTAALPGEEEVPLALAGQMIRSLMELPGAAGISSHYLTVLERVRGLPGEASGPAPAIPLVAEALGDLVAAVRYETPLFLILEDMQWSDRESHAVVDRLLQEIPGTGVLLLCSGRYLSGSDAGGPFRPPEDMRVTRLRLGPLSAQEVGELGEGEGERLHERTGGNPLLVAHALQGTLEDFLDSLLAHLPEAAELVCRAMAREEPGVVTRQQLRAWTGLQSPELDEAVRALRVRGIVVREQAGLTLAHAVLRERASKAGDGRLPDRVPMRRRPRGRIAAAAAGLARSAAAAMRGTAADDPPTRPRGKGN